MSRAGTAPIQPAALNENFGAPSRSVGPFLSPLGMPCQAPPWGYVAAADLTTGKIAWKHKNGTVRDTVAAAAALPDGRAGPRRADHDGGRRRFPGARSTTTCAHMT